jgi:cytidyltransferase-like protein
MIGLVLGRFQPLHPGHLRLIDVAMRQCEEVVVCIGSAQLADPISIGGRMERMQRQLALLYPPPTRFKIVPFMDPEDMEMWPELVTEQCALKVADWKRFYRSDQLPSRYERKLKALGYQIVYLKREKFYYRAPDGQYYHLSSATEIRQLHQKMKVPV